MAHVDLLNKLHKSTKRDYLARVLGGNKAEFATLAKTFDVEYWDAGRDTGYGGYHYDGRWRELAQTLRDSYQLKPGDKILDVGCGKGFLLYDLSLAVSGVEGHRIDISNYALHPARPEVRPLPQTADASAHPLSPKNLYLLN